MPVDAYETVKELSEETVKMRKMLERLRSQRKVLTAQRDRLLWAAELVRSKPRNMPKSADDALAAAIEYAKPPARAYPWHDGGGIYDDCGPKETVTFTVLGVSFMVEPTSQTGINSGRRRYAVYCLTCDEGLHEATTGPESRCEAHLDEKH